MRLRGLPAALMLLASTGAHAGLSQADLTAVAAAPPPGARLDLQLTAPDMSGAVRTLRDILGGRAAFLVFVDYTCKTLCGTELELLGAALERASLDPARYRILVLGIDPKDTPGAARAMQARELPAALYPVTDFLLPDRPTLARATAALGFRYAYDPARDQFAHAAVVYVIAADGAVQGTLSPFALTTADLTHVVDTTARRRSLVAQIRMLCYGYDPATGVYSARIALILQFAAVATIGLLGGSMVLLMRLHRRAK